MDAHIAAVDKGNPGENYLLGGEEARFIDVINMLEDKFGRTKSTKITPDWMLKIGSVVFSFSALLTGREPQITPEKFDVTLRKPSGI